MSETDHGKRKEAVFLNLRTGHDSFPRSEVTRFRDHGSDQLPGGSGLRPPLPPVIRFRDRLAKRITSDRDPLVISEKLGIENFAANTQPGVAGTIGPADREKEGAARCAQNLLVLIRWKGQQQPFRAGIVAQVPLPQDQFQDRLRPRTWPARLAPLAGMVPAGTSGAATSEEGETGRGMEGDHTRIS